jgi:cytochrome b6-f complex iron-sulfur subunit
MAEKKKMSVAEILAAARAKSSNTGPAESVQEDVVPEPSAGAVTDSGAAASVADDEQPAPKGPKGKTPVTSPSASATGGGRPSVADILAAARAKKAAAGEPGAEATPKAEKSVGKPALAKSGQASAEKPSVKPSASGKPVGKPTAGAASAAASAAQTGVQRDTASILAAARGGAKPGPVSKADASPAVTARMQATAGKPKPAAPAAEKPTAVRVAPAIPARPAKPAAKKDAEEDRRSFLQIAMGSFMAVGFTALSVTGGLFTLGLARYMFPNVLAEPPSRFKVGFREGFPTGKVETKFVPQYGVWVVNSEFGGQQQIYALKTVCTHLGCTPNWLEAEQKFKCPCHGSGFYKDGVNFEGPAPRPLERYAIRISDDGQLEIDKSKSFQEELGQWADPDSYVNV